MPRSLPTAWLFTLLLTLPAGVRAQGKAEPPAAPADGPTVGISATVDVILPGGELEVVPLEDRKTPLVVRIEDREETANGFRYRIVYYGLEPGEFDLRSRLRWKDPQNKSPIPERPVWRVRVQSVLPPGQVVPHELSVTPDVSVGGYRTVLWVLGTLWVLGLLLLLFWPRRKPPQPPAPETPRTLADRLRPLVEAGLKGTLSTPQVAELERLLMAYWRKQLKLEQLPPLDALQQLKAHPQAGELLRTLEQWLHAPAGRRAEVSAEALLRPYQATLLSDHPTLEATR